MLSMFLLLYALPVLPLIVDWTKFPALRAGKHHASIGALLFATISWLWLFSLFYSQRAIGPSYSSLRFAILNTNAFLCFITIFVALLAKPGRQFGTAISAAMLTLFWLFTAAINTAV